MNQEINLAQMQPIVYQQLQRSFEHGRIAHAYLFEGEKGTGKHEVGIWLAQHLFCTQMKDNLPCGKCNNCQRIEKKEHPDVLVIEPEGQTIKVDQIRRLQTEFSRSGYESRKKFLIKEAEKMNSSAANSLLKFLEEPLEIFSGVRNRCSRKNSPYYSISLSSSAFSRTFERSTDPSIARRADSIGKSKTFGFLNKQFRKSS